MTLQINRRGFTPYLAQRCRSSRKLQTESVDKFFFIFHQQWALGRSM